ncbi:MAG: hypothetical protein D6729_00060 [Deltaproteobacteria bacterium]|nr:MAG: hypothetical protein D6729_00060 [Deltaproteobacteria bacterium]
MDPIILPGPRPVPTAPSTHASEGGGFAAALSKGLAVASDVAGVAGAVVPGAGLVSVALGGLSRLLGGGAEATATPAGTDAGLDAADALIEQSRSLNLRYLMLQERMQRETRTYTAISNIMKVRHEAAKNTLANLR